MKKPTFPRGIDSTMRSSFVSCPRKFFYGYCKRLQQYDSSIHLLAGGAFAAGCEAYRLYFFTTEKPNHEQAMYHGITALTLHWGKRDTYEGLENKSLWMMWLALDEYFSEHYPANDPLTPHFVKDREGKRKPCVEVNFAIPIEGTKHPDTGEEILYVGRYDMVGVYNKQLYVVDEKTTSRLGPTWVKQWELRGQFIGYCWAAQEFGMPVVGAIVRGMSILKNSFGHAFAIQQIKPFLIADWHEQLVRDVNRMVECWERGVYDQNFGDSCGAYSGCEFKPLCMSENPEAWEGTYKHNPWNPLASQEEMDEEKARIDGANETKPQGDY